MPEVDGLRFVAILWVFLFHACGYTQVKSGMSAQSDGFSSFLARYIQHFDFGVQLFFAISGFILALPFAARRAEGRAPVSLKSYYLRRVTRLEPPYIVNLLAIFTLLVVVKHDSATGLLPHLLASLSYTHSLFYGEPNIINYVTWSLEIEVQFYIIVPLLATVFAISKPPWRRAVILALCVSPIVLQQFVHGLSLSILGQLQYFMLGFLLADFFVTDWKRQPRRNAGWDVVSIVAWVAMLWLLNQKTLRPWLLPVCVLLCYVGVFRGRVFNCIFRNRWLVTIGGMCYTIYLYHFLIISVAGRWSASHTVRALFWPNLLVQSVCLGFWVLSVSALLFLAVEKPCMYKDWPNRVWSAVRRTRRPALAKGEK